MKSRFGLGAVLALGIVVLTGLGEGTGLAWAQNDAGPTASLKFAVVREASGKPVSHAQVVLHPANRKSRPSKGDLDLKTDADGYASVDGVPYGSVEVQVLAPGFQTFGADYEVKQAEMEITVKLKRPAGQYSIYGNHDEKKEQKPQ